MPKRTDIHSILLIGSGPIVIGQACEFDYSGTQACKALKEEGFRVILINSNPATIMTDPTFADRTYIEPITTDMLERIIEAERPDALLPTIGGQTALNAAIELAESGILERHGVELIGAKLPAIKKAEDRDLFKAAMQRIGLDLPRSGYAHSLDEARAIQAELGMPLIIRPSRTLGGTGGSIAETADAFQEQVRRGLDASPTHEVLVEESIAGWKEFELEVMRDVKDNVVIVCSIENFDPLGVHTGDSITVAPAQTLTDKEYQLMRDAAIAIIREIGVDTGGSNIQFAVHPDSGRLVVIEMNPRVSRSSALASKATGFPIAKIAAKLAVGYTLDEIRNDITRETPACFEPTIDYVVTKIPRFTFEKFPAATDVLGPQMKSVGEVMAIGRTFKESLQKAIRSLETDSYGFDDKGRGPRAADRAALETKLRVPNARRLWYLADAYREGFSTDDLYRITKIDPWFLDSIRQIVECESALRHAAPTPALPLPLDLLRQAKRMGFADVRLGQLTGRSEEDIRQARRAAGLNPVYKMVDTCGAEFPAFTPYLYSTYEDEDESAVTTRRKIMILGGGPNRIGQGIEFDYCCVHAAFALKEDGFETIMVNCNPETVSTDYDTSDKLYFEPLTREDVLAIVEREQPEGVIVQFGGQTPLKLAVPLEQAGVRILGTTPDSIDRAEDRERFAMLLSKLQLRQPANGIALSVDTALRIARQLTYPVLVRPSYVLGGRAMEIVYDDESLRRYMERALDAAPERTILIDKFLDDAIELDVDAISDGTRVVIGGIMEHIEHAGVHSGDSACSLPTKSISSPVLAEIRRQTSALALELQVVGLMNVQFAVKGDNVYILEVNPRASRTVPFVSKATGVPLAKLAARVMGGRTLDELGMTHEVVPPHISVKEAVFPFAKFPGVDTLLGPEMKSTGEVMGIGASFGAAFAKAQIAAGTVLPTKGAVFISVRDEDKTAAVAIAARLARLGFQLIATHGTAAYLSGRGLRVEAINKVLEGSPHCVDAIVAGRICLVINTPMGFGPQLDSFSIRRTALKRRVPYFTTIAGAEAAAEGVELLVREALTVCPLQEHYRRAEQLVSSLRPPSADPLRAARPQADPLHTFLSAVAAPLNFLAQATPDAAARTQFPAATLARRAQALLVGIDEGATRHALEALSVELCAYERASGEQRSRHVERCRVLIEQLQRQPAAAPPPYRRTTANPADDLKALAQSVQFVPGVGPRRAEQFRKLGITSVEELLYHLPFRYEDRRALTTIRNLRVGEVASVVGEITHLAERHVGRMQRRMLEGVLRDETGLLGLTWFHQVAYFRNRYQIGQRCLVHGKVEGLGAQRRMVHPEVDLSTDFDGAGILPVYNKPTTTSVAVMRKIVQQTVQDWGERLASVLPEAVVRAAGITDLQHAMQLLHRPQRDGDVEPLNEYRSLGHRSLVFDELFFLQLGMALRRRSVEREAGLALPARATLTRQLDALLPFTLTGAQARVRHEIMADMTRASPMHRLVQGDVGSGKTIVALFAALQAIENGYQAAFMAPTELLAEQHFSTISGFSEALGVQVVLLTGELTRPQRRVLHERIRAGAVQLVIGTHALIQEGVIFKALGLGVIDEQHRFGVLQRAALRKLGGTQALTPDILLMTATPIPRTLALAVYGDLDISVLDELPPGRQPVRTLLRHEGERAKVYDIVKGELDRGHQGYVVYPLVESSEDSELRDATTMATELARTVFHGYRVGLVHGKMKSKEKDAVMRRFKAGDVQLLVSTTVIEVGIDVPNATVMVVEHAERFGLSQLHQLRGRVGRGHDSSVCVLLTTFHRGDDTQRRLQAMASTTDGFRIAEADLEIRGPGEMLGTRQSGVPDFRVANLIRDRSILEDARTAADKWLQHDPVLARPESTMLRTVLAHRWAGRLELGEIG